MVLEYQVHVSLYMNIDTSVRGPTLCLYSYLLMSTISWY